LSLALLLVLTAQAAEPPRGVNNSVLATAAEFETPGPARVCLVQTGIDLTAGETAYLEYLGIHWGGVRVVTAKGAYIVREGEGWADPRPPGRPVPMSRKWRVTRHASPEGPRYLLRGRSEYSLDADRPIAWLEGDALTGAARDRKILHRIDVDQTDLGSCRRHFVYGLNFILGNGDSE
jgi:hypothetical protein